MGKPFTVKHDPHCSIGNPVSTGRCYDGICTCGAAFGAIKHLAESGQIEFFDLNLLLSEEKLAQVKAEAPIRSVFDRVFNDADSIFKKTFG